MPRTESDYTELKAAKPEELRDAVIARYQSIAHLDMSAGIDHWIRLGFAIAGPDGWQHCAPAWLREWREHK